VSSLREEFQRASDELDVRVEFDFTPSIPDALDLRPVLRLPDFGAANGMLIFRTYDEIRHCRQQVVDSGYGFSVLEEARLGEPFDIEVFKEMFIEWGWAGSPVSKPAWMRL